MLRINFKIFTFSWWQWLLILVFVWLLSVLWPIKGLLLPHNWWGQSLIVVMNDNEARPCGGFATAYGALNLPLLKFNVGSTYELNADLGPAPAPLDQVSDRLYFWDLGTSADLNQCAENFKSGYLANTDTEVDQVILMPMSFLENWAKLLGNNSFFADISRQVADVDHHDEAALETRKNPAGEVMKSMLGQTVFNPLKWRQTTALFKDFETDQKFFWSGYSKFKWPRPEGKTSVDLLVAPTACVHISSISEWNLGGGKSSRYLDKTWEVSFREVAPDKWEAKLDLRVEHLGGYDKPLSQDWKGGFEWKWQGKAIFIPAEINPGETWTHQEIVPITTTPCSLGLYVPLEQDWHTKFDISVIPQQLLTSKNLSVQESVGAWRGQMPAEGMRFSWQVITDLTPPFLTLHKPIDPNVLEADAREALNWVEGDLIVELHFNEPFETENLQASLQDRDHTVPAVTENLATKNAHQLDLTTLLLNFAQEEYQKDERFYLSLEGVTDVWGNEYQNELRTIITR